MSIVLPAVAITTLKQSLNVVPVAFYNPATVPARSIVATLDWLNDYGAGLANPNINVLVGLAGAPGGAQQAIDQVKSVKIDNTNNDYSVFVYFLDSTDTIVAPPNTIIWEPVVTNSKIANVILNGAEDGGLGVTRIYFCNFIVPPYVNAQQPEAVDLRLASPLIGGGSSLASVTVDNVGSWYNSGAMSVTGGGGSDATAEGTLDQFGRFTGVAVTAGGTEFIGPPVVAATGTQTAPPAWVYEQGTVVNVTMCTYAGKAWIANFTVAGGTQPSVTPPPNMLGNSGQYLWRDIGISPVPQLASFTGNISTSTGIITNSDYGPAALGDQGGNYVDTFNSATKFRRNLFGTPLGAGIITISAVHVFLQAAADAAQWTMKSDSRDLFDFSCGAQSGLTLLDLSGVNLKLDASVEWYLEASVATGNVTTSHGFAWTYTP